MVVERPEVGDVIIVGQHRNTSRHWLVVKSERRVSHDSLRGDSYWVDEFAAVPLEYCSADLNDPELGPGPFMEGYLAGSGEGRFHSDTVKRFWISSPNGGMNGEGTAITPDRITVIGKAKVTEKVQVSYGYEKLSYI